jgi:Sec-independent protein translocase protein TatA
VAQSLVGSLEIPTSMVRGYSKGYMIVDPAAANLKLSGGAAAAAGEGYAKAKIAGKKAGEKAGAVASEAIDKGSFALGKALGKAKRAIKEAQAENEAESEQEQLPAREAPDVQVSAPQEPARIAGEKDGATKPEPKTYVPASQAKGTASAAAKAKPAAKAAPKPAAKSSSRPAQTKRKAAPKSGSEEAARAVGRELGKMGSMFGSFMDEYKKASK